MTNLEVLQAARERLSRGWNTSVFAKDGNGLPVACTYQGAVTFCAMGALGAVVGCSYPYGSLQVSACEALLAQELPPGEWLSYPVCRVATFNNMNTQQDVLDLFDRTIAKLVAAEAINKAMRASGPIPVETKQLVVDAMLAGQQVEVSVPS